MNLRRLIILSCLVGMIAARPLPSAATQGDAAAKPLDLPAMTLTPADVAAVGLPGFGRLGLGDFRSFDAYVALRAGFLNKPEPAVRAALEDAGWSAGYAVDLGVPATPGDPNSPLAREAFSVVSVYADAAGAAAAYDLNRDYGDVTAATVTLVPGARIVGDDSYLTRTTSAASGQEAASDQIDLTLRRDNVVASTGLIAFGAEVDIATPAGTPAAIALVEAMAARLLARIDGVLAGESPDLSNRTLRLGDAEAVAFSTEGYRRLAGDDPPFFNGYEDDFPGAGDAFTNVVAAYEVNQGLQLGSEPSPGDPYYVARLLRFADEEQAAAHLARVRDLHLSPAETPADEIAGAAALGDESWTVGYAAEFDGHPLAGFAVHARVGATAMMLLLEAGSQPDMATVETLAAAQAACLDAGVCPAIPVPASLTATALVE